jgi:hypothetical protein
MDFQDLRFEMSTPRASLSRTSPHLLSGSDRGSGSSSRLSLSGRSTSSRGSSFRLVDLDVVLADGKEHLAAIAAETFSQYDASVQAISDASTASETEVRTSINHSFQALKQKHLSELETLEIERSLEVARAKRRKSALGLQLENLARGLARVNDVDSAIIVRDEAREVSRDDLTTRVNTVEWRYDRMVDQLEARQRTELARLEEAFLAAVASANAKTLHEISLQRRRAAGLLRSELTRTITTARKRTNDRNTWSQISGEFTELLNSLIISEKRTYLFEEPSH